MHHFLLSTVTCKVGAVVSYRIVLYRTVRWHVQDRTGQDRTGHTTIPKVVWVHGLLNPSGKTIYSHAMLNAGAAPATTTDFFWL